MRLSARMHSVALVDVQFAEGSLAVEIDLVPCILFLEWKPLSRLYSTTRRSLGS